MPNVWFYQDDGGWYFSVDGGPTWGCYNTWLDAVNQAWLYILGE